MDIVKEILKEDFHAVNFEVDGVHYCFSGWWMLDCDNGDEKIYDSKEEFLYDPIFNGKTISEANVENIDLEFFP